jgi:multisubunit Na+/H+ antiporter MnhB subunit
MIFGKRKKSFRAEFRRQLRLAISAAIGFSVAFAWRNVVWGWGQGFVNLVYNSTNVVLDEVLTGVAITFFAVILLFVSSKILREK